MTFNDGVRIQRKTSERTRLFLLLDCIQENTRDYDKKENEKKNTTSRRDKIDIKKERTRKSRTRILKETMNISRRQEQKKR